MRIKKKQKLVEGQIKLICQLNKSRQGHTSQKEPQQCGSETGALSRQGEDVRNKENWLTDEKEGVDPWNSKMVRKRCWMLNY